MADGAAGHCPGTLAPSTATSALSPPRVTHCCRGKWLTLEVSSTRRVIPQRGPGGLALP